MSETTQPKSLPANPWGADLDVAVCKHCHWRYLIPCGAPPPTCPNCYKAVLEVLPEGLPEMPAPYVPELVAPFSLSEKGLAEAVQNFAAGIPFPPPGLTPSAVRARLTPVYLPMWLVDGIADGRWQAEAGFDYQVISHQEMYTQTGGGWQTREIREPRVRWEYRIGTLSRAYQNIAAPALDDTPRLEKQIGPFNLDSALSYTPDQLGHSVIRLPDHPPKESWSEAAAAFQRTAAAECQQACGANHLRQFHWKAQFTRLNWTLMLLPAYSACYLDDQGQPQPILLHGQNGKVCGTRKSSPKRAGRTALVILAIGLLLLLAGLLLDSAGASNPGLAMISSYVVVLGVVGLLAAGAPLIIAWDFNRRQALERVDSLPSTLER